MSKRRQFLVLFVIVFFVLVPGIPVASASLPRPAARLLQALNAARRARGLPALHVDWTLMQAARSHSTDMLAHDYFAHGDFAGRLSAFHVHASRMGENLAWGSGSYGTAAAVVQEWLDSPEHRAVLLDPHFGRIGVGVARGSFQGVAGATVVTADFAGG